MILGLIFVSWIIYGGFLYRIVLRFLRWGTKGIMLKLQVWGRVVTAHILFPYPWFCSWAHSTWTCNTTKMLIFGHLNKNQWLYNPLLLNVLHTLGLIRNFNIFKHSQSSFFLYGIIKPPIFSKINCKYRSIYFHILVNKFF